MSVFEAKGCPVCKGTFTGDKERDNCMICNTDTSFSFHCIKYNENTAHNS